MPRFGRAYPAQRIWTPKKALPQWIGGGSAQGNTTAIASPVSWTEIVPAAANLAIIWVLDVVSSVTPAPSATLGGTAMTLTKNYDIGSYTSTYSMYLYCFTMFNPPAGSKAFVVTEASTSGLGWMGTDYYENVSSLGTVVVAASGSAATIILNVGSTKRNILYAAVLGYGAHAAGDTIGTFVGGAQRSPAACSTASANSDPLIFGDSLGNGSTLTFNATRSDASFPGGGAMALPLIPAAA